MAHARAFLWCGAATLLSTAASADGGLFDILVAASAGATLVFIFAQRAFPPIVIVTSQLLIFMTRNITVVVFLLIIALFTHPLAKTRDPRVLVERFV